MDAGIETVITIDESSGRLHKRYRDRGAPSSALATREGCNVDQAGAWRIATPSEVAEAPPEAFCRNDFPELDEGSAEGG